MDTMNKYCTLIFVGFLVIFSTCSKKEDIGSQDYIEENKDNVSNSIDSVVSEKKLNEVEEFVLEYYKTRNELFAIYKFRIMGESKITKYYSTFMDSMSKAKSQEIYVLGDSYEISQIEFFPQCLVGFDEKNNGIFFDQYRVSVKAAILGKINNGVFIKQEEEHSSSIIVLDSNEKYEVFFDNDLSIIKVQDHGEMGDIYIFEDDISEFIK